MTVQPQPTDEAHVASRCDAVLVARLRAGEASAFEELVLAHAPAMLAVARRLLVHEADAEDAVQDACLSAFRALDRFDGHASLATWLHRIVLNACLMRLRAARRRPERALDELLPQFLDDGHQRTDTRPWRPHALAELERSELCSLVRAKIEELPQPYREVLLLRDIEGLDTAQTARLLATSCGALKVRLHRARQALRTLLEPYHVEATT